VLECRDALHAAGTTTTLVNAGSDAEIDEVLAGLPKVGVVVVVDAPGQLRAVVRRLVRGYAPPPGRRPADLPPDRTLPDLPPLGILTLSGDEHWLGVPSAPAAVAAAMTRGTVRRLDLLRTDAGSVTLDGTLLGAAAGAGSSAAAGGGTGSSTGSGGPEGQPARAPFTARIEIDDAVLSAGDEPLLAAVVGNGPGYATVGGLPMLVAPDPGDGVVDVAVAVPVPRGRFRRGVTIEVRRASGRAVSIQPSAPVPLLDDGVAATLDRRRTWWMERAAFAVHVPEDGTVGR
jgi:hypothetical protein